ncbi:threonine/serine dehydratase [Amylibacter sp. IMCC11727]|uniref:threonine/serine dehydratase n=1 Tax=Amylibacter sp. IMCC11727 TaxID=3039851 RepID=UPI00244E5B1D|nr:threonine/serine dehydratase [Amylibacter sp. IMCC11727]WGI21932.1 threonine/serine dehydratase [Amylibacter sp. IMCC11727]
MDWTQEITKAATRLEGHTVRTPVLSFDGFGLGYPIEMKLEQMQRTGSFKARGAFNTLLSSDVPNAGLVAASGGNHGAAVAYAAKKLGHKAKIFVPEFAGPAKIGLIKRSGADLTVVQGEYANALQDAQAYEAKTGAMQVHAFDAVPTVAGQGTLTREWEEQGLEADTILIAVGGGGLIAGAMAWLGNRRKIVAVEPEKAPTLHTALARKAPVDVEVGGVAANALGARKVGQICYDLAVETGTECVTVTDDAITKAQVALWQECRQLVEPAGATALTALMSGAYKPAPDERVAVLVCGGNLSDDPFG